MAAFPVAKEIFFYHLWSHLLRMTHTQSTLSLAELRSRIENGTVPSPNRTAILAFLDLARAAHGVEAFQNPDVLASETEFSTWFPRVPDTELAAAYCDAAIYGRCRESILRHVRLAGAWPEDAYTLLNHLAREYRRPEVNRSLMEATFPGMSLRALTRDMAIAADHDLRGTRRSEFRKSISTIDWFRTDPRVVSAGILGAEEIGPMPTYRDGDKHRVELPTGLADVLDRLAVGHALHARRAFELAVDFGILSKDGPDPGWSMSIENATRYHAAVKEEVSAEAADLYLRALLSLLRTTDPATVPHDVTADRVRRPKRYEANSEPRTRKTKRNPVVLPASVEAEVLAFAEDRSACSRRVRDLRRVLRNLLEAGLDIDSTTFFADAVAFLESTFAERADLTRRSYRDVLRTFLAHTNRLSPWDGLIARAHVTDASGVDMSGLLLMRTYAESAVPPITPAEIDVNVARKFLLQAQGFRNVPKCLAGLASLDALRPELSGFLPGPAIGDQRAWLSRRSGEMPEALEQSLRSDAEGAGYGKFALKELIVAARRLFSLTTDKTLFDATIETIPWRELIASADASHPREMSHYRLVLLRLADRVDRVWMPGWRELQTRIVKAGVPRAENPVDTLMSVAANTGLEPWQLDREWAWLHERSLRPDLRLTFARNIARFDALRRIEAIAAAGLMPTYPLGPMPPRGCRLKNAHLPLPRRFEAALEGETKQVLEAAHFIWRCLRAFGVHARGDDPAPAGLLADQHLERILAEQSFMTQNSAKLHLARIRDWRESRPGLM